jgi:hypothetical protein
VREQTQELASWALGESPRRDGTFMSSDSRADSEFGGRRGSGTVSESDNGRNSFESSPRPHVIPEASEPTSPEADAVDAEAAAGDESQAPTGSALTNLFKSKKQPLPQTYFSTRSKDARSNGHEVPEIHLDEGDVDEISEHTALLGSSQSRGRQYKGTDYLGRQWETSKSSWARMRNSVGSSWETVKHPAAWDLRSMAKSSADACSAVFLGVLLNLLDALSYGRFHVATIDLNTNYM